jgi:hypothetical protein
VAHYKAGVEVAACSTAGDGAAVCPGPGSRTVGGGVMTCLGRQKSERERGVEKLLSVVKESVGPEILGRGT